VKKKNRRQGKGGECSIPTPEVGLKTGTGDYKRTCVANHNAGTGGGDKATRKNNPTGEGKKKKPKKEKKAKIQARVTCGKGRKFSEKKISRKKRGKEWGGGVTVCEN